LHTVDTIRIRIQTAGYPVPPIKELVPRPRIRSLYAGAIALSSSCLVFLCVELTRSLSTGLPVAIGFSVPALSVYLSVYEGPSRPPSPPSRGCPPPVP